jgi:hypothetical protein
MLLGTTLVLDGVVVDHTLALRALGLLVARDERLLANVLWWDVVARRQSDLEEEFGPLRLGDDLAVHGDLGVAGYPGRLPDGRGRG